VKDLCSGLRVVLISKQIGCPLCGRRLSNVATGQDYFCRDCMAAVCVAQTHVHIYRAETGESFQMPWPLPEAGSDTL
jgi:hypothetical protein